MYFFTFIDLLLLSIVYAKHVSQKLESRRVRFLIVIRYLLHAAVETLQAEICRNQRFSKGMGYFERKFQT